MARAPITWRNVNSQLRSDPLEAFNQAADSVRESIGGIQSGIQGIADREAAERGRTLESLFRERITGLDALDANASVLRDQNALRELAGGRVSGFNGNEFLNTIRSEIENPINKNLSVLQAKASSPTATAADVDAFQSAIAQNQRLSNIAEFTQSGLDASNALTNRDDVAFAANYGFDPATANSYQEAEKQFLEYLSGRESIDANERQQFLNQFADRFDRAFKISDENKVNIAAEFQVAENSLNQGLKAEQRSLANKQAQLTLPKSVQLTNKSGQNVGNLLEDMEKVSDIVGNWDANDLNNIRGRMSREFGGNIPQARIDQVVASMVEFGYFGNNLKGDADKLSREILQNDLDNNRAILKDIDGIYDNISRYERGLVQLPGLTGSARKLVRQDGFTAESVQNLIKNGLGLNDLYKPAFSTPEGSGTPPNGGTPPPPTPPKAKQTTAEIEDSFRYTSGNVSQNLPKTGNALADSVVGNLADFLTGEIYIPLPGTDPVIFNEKNLAAAENALRDIGTKTGNLVGKGIGALIGAQNNSTNVGIPSPREAQDLLGLPRPDSPVQSNQRQTNNNQLSQAEIEAQPPEVQELVGDIKNVNENTLNIVMGNNDIYQAVKKLSKKDRKTVLQMPQNELLEWTLRFGNNFGA